MEIKDNESETRSLISKKQTLDQSKKITTKQKVWIVNVVIMEFIIGSCGCLSNAFFARVMRQRGGSALTAAIVLQVNMITMIFGSYLFGRYMYKIGQKVLLLSSVLLVGFSQVLLGVLEYVDDITLFTTFGIMLRGLNGLGFAAYSVSAYSTTVAQFPHHVSEVFGAIQAASGSAHIIGPAYGGFMYDRYGMFVALASWGVLPIITLPVQCILLPKQDKERKEQNIFDIKKYLCNFSVLITLVLTSTVFGILGYIEVTLALYLPNVSATMVGLCLLLIGSCYAITGPLAGFAVNLTSWMPYVIIIFGSVMASGSLLLFNSTPKLPIVLIGCLLFGISAGMIMVPMFTEQLKIANGGQVSDRSDTYIHSNVSGIWNSFVSGGLGIVPMVASAVQTCTPLTFSNMFYILGSINIVVVFLLVIGHLPCMKRK